MSDSLTLGTEPGALNVILVIGDPWGASLIYNELTDPDDKTSGVPVAWPAAPVLEFHDPALNVPATLSADTATNTANSQATWALTEDQVATYAAKSGSAVRLSVSGATWWMGVVTCRS